MGYKFKPNAAQRKAYAETMRKRDKMIFIGSKGAIRVGCYVKWHSKNDDTIYSGFVKKETRRSDNQHQFTARLDDGGNKSVMGRNLYDSLLDHVPGGESKEVSF